MHVACAVIEAHNGLHALRHTKDQHDDQHGITANDAKGADGQIGLLGSRAICHERAIHEHVHRATRQLHGEGGDADGRDGPHDGPRRTEGCPTKPHDTTRQEEVRQDVDGTDHHCYSCGDGRAADAHAQWIDEDVIQHHVDQRAEEHRCHGLARVARGAHDGVVAEAEGGEDVGRDDDLQVFHGVRQRAVAGAEESQQRLHINVARDDGKDLCDEREIDGVGECLLCPRGVALPEQDGYPHRCTGANQHTEGLQEEEDRERDGQSRERVFAHALTDEDPIHDVVQRVDYRPNHCGHGIIE